MYELEFLSKKMNNNGDMVNKHPAHNFMQLISFVFFAIKPLFIFSFCIEMARPVQA